MAIRSFSDRVTEEFYLTGLLKAKVGWAAVRSIARRKLDMVNYATELKDLKSPPGSRLEALKGDLRGFHSIRINSQWRVVFRWATAGAEDVTITDYH
jgi:proteic killer suppression protein